MSQGLKSYLEHFHQVTMLDDNTAALQEKLFYRDVEYIIHIPSDFFDNCILEGQKLPVTKIPGSYTSFYVDQQINSFLNNVRTYQAAGFSEEEAANAAKTPGLGRYHSPRQYGDSRYNARLCLLLSLYSVFIPGNSLLCHGKYCIRFPQRGSAKTHVRLFRIRTPSKYGKPAGSGNDRLCTLGHYHRCLTAPVQQNTHWSPRIYLLYP